MTIKLVVQGREDVAMEYARQNGIRCVFVMYNKSQDMSILRAMPNQYDEIRNWWIRGTTLVRTM